MYLNFFNSDELQAFPLKGRYDYEVPYYNINGDKDYQTNYILAREYFDQLNAPYKEMFIMGRHHPRTSGIQIGRISKLVHQVAENEREIRQ